MMNFTFLMSSLFWSGVVAWITAYVVTRRGSVAHLSTLFEQQRERLSLLEATLETQDARILNLRARVGMQKTREKQQQVSAAPLSTETDDDKARIRRELSAKLANGQIKTIGR